MVAGTVLVVEHNPGTLKMLSAALEGEGYVVLQAPDARTALGHVSQSGASVDLIIQDLILPDMAGLELTRRLRAIPEIADLPILASSGFLSSLHGAEAIRAGFSDLLVKPIDPVRLVEAVRARMPLRGQPREDVGRARRLLLADDDPIQLKLVCFQLTNAGFEVTTASDGVEALRLARAQPPEVIVSDLLMPRMDGFELCMEVRRDPALAQLPVLLLSSQYLEESDRQLAKKIGANRFISRSPSAEELVREVTETLRENAAHRPAEPVEMLKQEHVHRVIRQLERQISLSAGLAQRCAIQATQLSLLGGVADALSERADVGDVLREVLPVCLDAAGISRALIYLWDERSRKLRLRHAFGFAAPEPGSLEDCFGCLPLLQRTVMETGFSLRIPSAGLPEETARSLLAQMGLASAHAVPLGSSGHSIGVLFTGAEVADEDRAESDPLAFVRALGRQIGQAMTLAQAFAELRVAIAARDEFFVIASHELRTPLTALRLQVDTLQRSRARAWSPEKQDAKVNVISRQVERLDALIESLLDVNRIMVGEMVLTREPVELGEVVRLAVARLPDGRAPDGGAMVEGAPASARPEDGGMRARVRVDAPLPVVGLWDRSRLSTVVSNLLSNALKFSQNQPVEIAVRSRDGMAELEVRDHGIGFPSEDRERIFLRFERAVPLRNYGGFGIGLWVVQQVVEAHGGRIRVASQEGEGSTFTLEIPLGAEGAATAAAGPAPTRPGPAFTSVDS